MDAARDGTVLGFPWAIGHRPSAIVQRALEDRRTDACMVLAIA